jgi:hypothetical protein
MTTAAETAFVDGSDTRRGDPNGSVPWGSVFVCVHRGQPFAGNVR